MTLPTRALGRSGGAGILQTDSVSRDQRFIEVQLFNGCPQSRQARISRPR
jgi:hypothetical protein